MVRAASYFYTMNRTIRGKFMQVSKIKKIYVAENESKYKIGVSKDIETRMTQLSCGCPKIKCIYSSDYIFNAFELESVLHEKFSANCVGGEWFVFKNNSFLETIRNFINKYGEFCDYAEEKRIEQLYLNGAFEEFLEESIKDINEHNNTELQNMKFENEQIEKFISSIQGADVKNVYSDCIYFALFEKTMEELIDIYKPLRYESFRNKLSDEESKKVQSMEMLVSGLINCGWGYEQIKNFISENSVQRLAS